MKISSFQKPATTGLVFGIIVIFLALIGFTDTASGMIQKVGGHGASVVTTTPPLRVYSFSWVLLAFGMAGRQPDSPEP